MKNNLSRRHFIQNGIGASLALTSIGNLPDFSSIKPKGMRLGLVTYQWGRDWDLPTLIANCEATGYHGVELRVQHAHKVESNLTAIQRKEVKKRFNDSSVQCIGYGSNFEYHSPDPVILKKNIDETKEYIKLCKDIGATGIKIMMRILSE